MKYLLHSFAFFLGALLITTPYDARAQNADNDISQLRASAEAGNTDAEYQIAEAYRKGEGVPQDVMTAFHWYQKAANANDVDAQMALGFIYRGGEGVPMDKVLSYMWFQIAISNGRDSAIEVRNDVAWSMTQGEIDEAKSRAREWKPSVTSRNTE